MKTSAPCVECFVKNALHVTCRFTKDRGLRERILKTVLRGISEFDFNQPPPLMARETNLIVSEMCGKPDPYREEKDLSTQLARQLLDEILRDGRCDLSDFETRVRLSVAGNIIDFGVNCGFDLQTAKRAVEDSFLKPVDSAAVARFREAMEKADSILYLLDNCGEAVFDRMLIEPFREKLTICVRGKPVLNDVTRRELESSGLANLASRVIDTGDSTPGISFAESSPEFRKAFDEADLVVAKGQGNFETLNMLSRPMVFLFMAKCPVVCADLGTEVNALQVRTWNF